MNPPNGVRAAAHDLHRLSVNDTARLRHVRYFGLALKRAKNRSLIVLRGRLILILGKWLLLMQILGSLIQVLGGRGHASYRVGASWRVV